MPFQFTCPYCFKSTLVAEELAGQSGPCAGCGKTVEIPRQDDAASDKAQLEDTEPARAQATNRRMVRMVLKSLGLAVLIGLSFVVITFLLWPVFQGLKSRRDIVSSMNNLQTIAAALDAYAVDHGTYPPSIVYDQAGKPMHSWRVLILEYLGYEALHARYDFDQPWDSTNNAQLLSSIPPVYVSPGGASFSGSESNYMLITGSGTLFPPSGPLRPSQIQDGANQTLLLVEVSNNTNEWTKPMDLDVAKLNPRIGSGGANSIGGVQQGGAAAVFADGTSIWLPNDLDPNLLDAMITPSAGEPLDPNDYLLNQSP